MLDKVLHTVLYLRCTEMEFKKKKKKKNHSAVVKIRTLESFDGQVVISKPWPDLIAGILSHWVSLILIHMTKY